MNAHLEENNAGPTFANPCLDGVHGRLNPSRCHRFLPPHGVGGEGLLERPGAWFRQAIHWIDSTLHPKPASGVDPLHQWRELVLREQRRVRLQLNDGNSQRHVPSRPRPRHRPIVRTDGRRQPGAGPRRPSRQGQPLLEPIEPSPPCHGRPFDGPRRSRGATRNLGSEPAPHPCRRPVEIASLHPKTAPGD